MSSQPLQQSFDAFHANAEDETRFLDAIQGLFELARIWMALLLVGRLR